jgi:glutathione gamma-glutamylcysteinyltransferase
MLIQKIKFSKKFRSKQLKNVNWISHDSCTTTPTNQQVKFVMPENGIFKRELPDTCTDFGSEEGKKLFGEALAQRHMESYFRLAGQYHAQSEPTYCGVAVLCMVLNGLSMDPARIWKSPWRWYSEEMMACCYPLDEIKQKGIDFDVFHSMASCKGADVSAYRHEDRTEEQFRADIIAATSNDSKFIVVSYDRKAVGQTGSGHFCPVAGFHAEKDMLLLLDVARFKYPPHWIPLSLLYTAMKPIDSATGKSRGYFIIKKSDEEVDLNICKTKLTSKE